MEKCEWKDGEFIGCCGLSKYAHNSDKTWDFCPYCGADIKEPAKIKLKMFGRFWDDDQNDSVYGVLALLRIEEDLPYKRPNGEPYKHFSPGLPEGFNQDGTPKEKKE